MRLVALNARGRRIGEHHPSAVLTERDVQLLFELREEGWGYGRIARKLECSKTQVKRIVKGTHRGQHAARFKRA